MAALFALMSVVPSLRAAEDVTVVDPESVGMSSERLQRINTFINEYIDANQIAGAVTLVARKGKVVHYDAQGWRDKENGVAMSHDTIFEMMSMTKPIVSVALMMLFEEGRFLLDDSILRWLPEYENHTVRINADGVRPVTVQESRPVTVRHVLTHTSGLTLNPRNRGLTEAQIADVTNDGKGWATLAERVAHAAVIPASFHPGDEWQYGDSTDYVAVLVEKISGQSIDVFLRDRIFEPLGMTDTYYYVPQEKVDRIAAVYRPDEDGQVELMQAPAYREPTRMFRGVAGLSSTAADYYQFAQMIANGGELNGVRLLGRMTVDNMISNHIGAGKDVYIRGGGYGFGLGFGVLTNSAASLDASSIGSYTWGGAYGTLYWADPVEDLIGILLIQIRPYNQLGIRPLFSNVVTQAVTDSFSDQKPIVMGRPTPH
tara:strand:- start:1853 stop:3139 length:1287 start_codon:yes stop_codon:yes gene_type:complete